MPTLIVDAIAYKYTYSNNFAAPPFFSINCFTVIYVYSGTLITPSIFKSMLLFQWRFSKSEASFRKAHLLLCACMFLYTCVFSCMMFTSHHFNWLSHSLNTGISHEISVTLIVDSRVLTWEKKFNATISTEEKVFYKCFFFLKVFYLFIVIES